jgi:energy-coupling factor transporter ATP-binding protein EcfA2
LLTHLARTSIGESVASTAIKNLSYSQRSCVIFAKLTFYPPHLLIMDEPTNFLDLDSVDSLIRAANKFSGGLITVTHNRDFLRRCSKTFLSIVPGQFQELPDMKAAERATYSFISAMEEGRAVDAKTAIIENRGGGAAHTDEEQAIRAKALRAQQRALKKKREAEIAEKKAVEDAAAAKEAARKAKVAAQRTDWKADEVVWVNHGGKWQEATVTRNVPGVGVTVQLSTGACKMLDAKKLKAENPQGGPKPAGAASSAQPRTAGGRGQSSQGRGQSSGGRGQSSGGRGAGANNRGAAKDGNQPRNTSQAKGKGQQQAKNTGSQGASRNTQQRQNSNSAPIR